MRLTRREYLTATATLPLTAAVTTSAAMAATSLPMPTDFATTDIAYLDNGSQHPIPLASLKAVEAYYAKRALDPVAQGYTLDEDGPRAKFAALVGADADEIAWVQSTTAGEQMVLRALGLPESGGHIVTDTLHFFGSLPLYEEMAKQGCEVTWLKPVDGRIRLADMKAAVRRGTKLVALSLVSTINGFEHDLKAVCDIAHAAGALVYADIIHAAGCVPVDLHASGVDFAACASYKWLMGEFGLGFLYVRRDLLPRLKRTNYGYYGMATFQPHVYPLDPPGTTVADYSFSSDASGAFALGTHSHAVIAQLGASLSYIAAIGVPAIQRRAQELCSRLKRELPRRGYAVMTPVEATTPIVTCVLADARKKLAEPMAAAKVRLTISANRFRLTPSVQNGHADIDRFLAALPKA
ncbi:selenocysteine lyase/cysteine desulfurase [Sphingomonas jinjuensis]|uniref:Selenocysteine lyase/cysteine desulfurase n=1 Tax=Sphingomonas jinjuensis TaxID=535907 RepID=A0A840FD97_9SPHN|nr:aminotransferase class V-fold PLP-dependent enzyme [Sphingomonas jinjuensis]MBB4155579.1 selenocysteine lyase/cysteine desulfurase [Sphingomonas jinjuensis]